MIFAASPAPSVADGHAAPAAASRPLMCDIAALSASQRARYEVLSEKLFHAAVDRIELPNGYAYVLDLNRLPKDAAGAAWCVVEVAQWVDLETRCCPFLDFGIDLGRRSGVVTLRLTGGENVKAFLAAEFPRPGAIR